MFLSFLPQVAKLMRSDAHFAFTVETCPDDMTEKGFRLLKNGRFGYSRSYIDSMINSMGASYRAVV